MTAQRFRQRPSRVVPSVISAALLALIGAGALWASIVRLSQNAWPPIVTDIEGSVASWTWGSTEVLIALVGLAVGGFALLLCVVIPGRRVGHVLRPRVTEVAQETLTDSGLARIVAARTSRVDGVDSTDIRGRGRSLELHITTPLRDGTTVKTAADARARSIVDALPLVRPMKLTTAMRNPKEAR